MRLATFNIQHGRSARGMVDLNALGAATAALGADVLALQEVDVGVPRSGRQDLAEIVAAATGLTAAFGAATQFGGGDYGNALLARGDIDDTDVVRLPSPRGFEPRSALLARVSVTGGPALSVAVTHLSYDTDEARVQLLVVADAIVDRPPPRVLFGDLNLGPAEVAAPLAARGLQLVMAGGATFPARRPRVRIDHVALSGFAAVAVSAPHTPVSDHRPLVVDISP